MSSKFSNGAIAVEEQKDASKPRRAGEYPTLDISLSCKLAPLSEHCLFFPAKNIKVKRIARFDVIINELFKTIASHYGR